MNDIIIYGCGSFGRMIEQIINDINQEQKKWNWVGFIDDDPKKHSCSIVGYPVLGGIKDVRRYQPFIVIGFSKPKQRQQALKNLHSEEINNYATLVHPNSWISRRVGIGEGSIIYPGVHIDVDVRIGCHNIFNKLCTIGHDSYFADFVTAAPAVNLGGNIRVGEGCEFGINSATIQGITIGEWVTIGAGAVVIDDLPSHCTAVGIPAKPIKFN